MSRLGYDEELILEAIKLNKGPFRTVQKMLDRIFELEGTFVPTSKEAKVEEGN